MCPACHEFIHSNPAESKGLLWKGRNRKSLTIEEAEAIVASWPFPQDYPVEHDIPELNLLLSQSDLNQRLLIEKVLQILKVRLDELKTIEKENQRDLQFMQDSAVWLTENMLEPWANERKSSAKLRWEEFRKNWLRNNPLK